MSNHRCIMPHPSSFPPPSSFPRKRESNAPARAPLRGFNYERAFAHSGFAICGDKSPFALSRKWTNGKGLDSRFRGNDEGDFGCRAFARAGRLAACAANGIMQRSKPCAVRRAPCAVRC
ncbi:MAG: hypothetical protein ACR2P4_03855 [Gammaproteobacteria bacterium]